MKWISVKDKMPKDVKDICDHEWFIVCSEHPLHTVILAYYSDGNWNFIGDLKEGADTKCNGGATYFISPEDITHWSPLPSWGDVD